MLFLRWIIITVILSFISVTLLFLKNSLISFYQFLSFVLFPSNNPGSGIILLDNSAYFFCSCTSAIDILFIYSVFACEASLVIFKDPSHFDNAFILYSQCWSILLFMDYAIRFIYFPMIKLSIILVAWPLCILLLQGEFGDTLPNIITLDLAQVAT